MPLRDHFRPPLADSAPWGGVHAQWPAMIVLALAKRLPRGYVAEPRVYLGSEAEIDVGTLESNGRGVPVKGGGTATAAWSPPKPTLAVETDMVFADEYEVRVYDRDGGRRLVAAVEIVSPSNKDRPENRRAFVGKCARLLQNQVSVVVVDLVTNRRFNLYRDLLRLMGRPSRAAKPPATYAVACRMTKRRTTGLFESWDHPLTVGERLPTLPLWLRDDLYVPLELEATYEATCRALRIP